MGVVTKAKPEITASQKSTSSAASNFSASTDSEDRSPSKNDKKSELFYFIKEQLDSDDVPQKTKLQLLTLMPPTWSVASIMNTFPKVTETMTRQSKILFKEKGILSTPDIKKGKFTAHNFINLKNIKTNFHKFFERPWFEFKNYRNCN